MVIIYHLTHFLSIYLEEGIIEGDQIQVAAFSLEYFTYLTGLTLGQ